MYFVLFTLASIMGGIVMYREFESMGANSVVSFFSSILLTFIGVYLLTSDRESEAHGGAGAPLDSEGEEGGMARLHGVALGGGFGLGVPPPPPPPRPLVLSGHAASLTPY